MAKFNIGDIVYLKAGSDPMTVNGYMASNLFEPTVVEVVFFPILGIEEYEDGTVINRYGNLQRELIHEDALDLYEEDEDEEDIW